MNFYLIENEACSTRGDHYRMGQSSSKPNDGTGTALQSRIVATTLTLFLQNQSEILQFIVMGKHEEALINKI